MTREETREAAIRLITDWPRRDMWRLALALLAALWDNIPAGSHDEWLEWLQKMRTSAD